MSRIVHSRTRSGAIAAATVGVAEPAVLSALFLEALVAPIDGVE